MLDGFVLPAALVVVSLTRLIFWLKARDRVERETLHVIRREVRAQAFSGRRSRLPSRSWRRFPRHRAACHNCRRLDLPCVADGIERQEQLDELRLGGCAGGQGALFAVPMPEAMVAEFIKDRLIEAA